MGLRLGDLCGKIEGRDWILHPGHLSWPPLHRAWAGKADGDVLSSQEAFESDNEELAMRGRGKGRGRTCVNNELSIYKMIGVI